MPHRGEAISARVARTDQVVVVAAEPHRIAEFRELVLGHYRHHGRGFRWRTTADPWEILISEVMLQQTQTGRIEARYGAFVAQFPTPEALARAPMATLLTQWSGLGYNRRALNLQRAAWMIVERHGGNVPAERDELLLLPGVGPSTAGGVLAFAFGIATVFVETNIRRAHLAFFAPDAQGVADRALMPLFSATLDRAAPRRWYYALMDYGASLTARPGAVNANRRSAHYAQQSQFEGSDRQVRGAVIRAITRSALSIEELVALTGAKQTRLEMIVEGLIAEGFLIRRKRRIGLADGSR